MEKSARIQAELRLDSHAFRFDFDISYHNRDSLHIQSNITKWVREFVSDPCTVYFILSNVHLEHTDP